MQQNLPQGFITIEDAIKLIESDKYDDAKVDTSYLVSHLDWIETNHNFRIPQMKTVEGKNGEKKHIHIESTYVEVLTVLQAELLKEAIKKHYREMVGKEYTKKKVNNVTNVYDDEDGSSTVARENKKPVAKNGQDISGDHPVETINGTK